MLKLILRPPDVKSQLTEKESDAGEYWSQEEQGTTEDEMVGWHHYLMNMSLSKLQEMVKDREAWSATVHGAQRVGHSWVTEQQQSYRRENWGSEMFNLPGLYSW